MKVNIIDTKNDVSVFFAAIPDNITVKQILPTEREREILSVSNERVRREKYSAWLLLEYAIKSALNITLDNAKLYKGENGKWKSELFELSISHSGSAVAVAISHAPVGIDLEPLGSARPAGFAKKILTEQEYNEYSALPESERNEFLLTRWCIKEAIFKKSDSDIFVPSKTETGVKGITKKLVSISGKEYFIAVSAEPETAVKFIDSTINPV